MNETAQNQSAEVKLIFKLCEALQWTDPRLNLSHVPNAKYLHGLFKAIIYVMCSQPFYEIQDEMGVSGKTCTIVACST